MMYYWKKLDTLSDESSNVSGIAPVNSNEVISNNVDQNFPSKRFFSPITIDFPSNRYIIKKNTTNHKGPDIC